MKLLRLLAKPSAIRLIFGGFNFTLIILLSYYSKEKMATLLLLQYMFNVIINVTCLTLSDLYCTSIKRTIYVDFRGGILISFSALAICNILYKDLSLMHIALALSLLIPLMLIKSWTISRLRLLEKYTYWILLHYGLPTLIFVHIIIRSTLFEGDWPLFTILMHSMIIYIAVVVIIYTFISRSEATSVLSENNKNDAAMFHYILLSVSLTLLPFSIVASHLMPNQLFILRIAQSIVSPIINIAQVAVRSDLLKWPISYFKNKIYILLLFMVNVVMLFTSNHIANFLQSEIYFLVILISVNLCIVQLVLLFVLRQILNGKLKISFRNLCIKIIGIGTSIALLRNYAEELTATEYALFILVITTICFGNTWFKRATR